MPTAEFALRSNWIAVASAEHARRGCAQPQQGFMQVCHGKCAPLKRVLPEDRVVYYAPTITMGGKDKCQSFVSIGIVQTGQPYEFDMGGGFVPYRRDVRYVPAMEASILPLLDRFEFVQDRSRWGYKFRFGLFNLDSAVGRARVGCWGRVRVGATTPQAHACKTEQRPRARRQWLNRVRSAVTRWVNTVKGKEVTIHAAFQVIVSGQLRNLGSRSATTTCA